MTRKIYLLVALVCGLFMVNTSFAQDDAGFRNLRINAQPKHMWEVGLHGGHFMVTGDINPKPGWGVGLHVRRALDYAWSIRIEGMIGRAFGIEPRNSGGSSISPGFANTVLRDAGYGEPGREFYHNYKMEYASLKALGVWSLNSFNFKSQVRKINWYVFAGPGVNTYQTWMDLTADSELNADGSNSYNFNAVDDGLNPGRSRVDRRTVTDNIRNILDGDYETRAEVALGRRSGDRDDDDAERQFNAEGTVGAGFSFRITPRFNIGIENMTTLTFGNEGDLLDGYRWRTVQDLTQFKDLINYSNIRLNINLGDKDENSEPLWWVSPLDLLGEDIAEVKSRPKLDLTDTDEDGIIDMLDQEKDTESGCPVDTRGVTLDSDGDGLADCRDKEIYSPPGYKVDSDGVANVPEPDYINENDVNRIVDAKIKQIKFPTPVAAAAQDWFLPMIHFDNDYCSIKNTEFGKLHHVAQVMKLNPGLRVVAEGHTDRRSGNCYNDVLSYNRATTAVDHIASKYGIDRSRFVIRWGGENTNLVSTDASNLMNRRVEFRVATSESSMGAPGCGVTRAGKGCGAGGGSGVSSGGGSSNYSGNKEAGY